MKQTRILKIIFAGLLTIVMGVGVALGYPIAHEFLTAYNVPYYIYNPRSEVVSEVDTASMPPAKAVPILMYHGITSKEDEENTSIRMFVAQMEALKRNGFETISLDELYAFTKGEFVLPARPIVITFDDGRKDSYFPSDDVLKKLGFEAVIFAVSGKSNDRDKFYLSWDNYRQMRASGRWDVQAHGTYSHQKILIDDAGTEGRYLSSRIFDEKSGLESEEDFARRLVNDYEQNIKDIEYHLGYQPKYFAIPLNDYGYDMATNYPESLNINHELIRKYYNLAFVQANDSSNVYRFGKGIYNYADADRWQMTRVEVKNMDPDKLISKLLMEYPKDPYLELSFKGDAKELEYVLDMFGDLNTTSQGLVLTANSQFPSSRAVFGDYHWSDYTVEMEIKRVKGQSVGVAAYLRDNKNFVSVSMTTDGLYVNENVDGKDIERGRVEFATPVGFSDLKLVMKNEGKMDVWLNGSRRFANIEISGRRGAVAFRVWEPSGKAEGLLKSLKIYASEIGE